MSWSFKRENIDAVHTRVTIVYEREPGPDIELTGKEAVVQTFKFALAVVTGITSKQTAMHELHAQAMRVAIRLGAGL